MAKGLAESLSWKDMSPRLTTGIQKIFGAYEFLLYAVEKEKDWSPLHRRGAWAKEPPVAGLQPEPKLLHPPHVQEVVPVLYIPIYTNEKDGRTLKGALFLKVHHDKDAGELLASGAEFGEQLGMTLNKAQLFTQMETHSRIDGLTGVLRRQTFMDRLAEEMKKAEAFKTQFCVMMVDIDHFKSINDGYGHAAGDAVLTRVGQLLKETFYETDVVGRYGGEEFIILMPRAQKDGVMRKAESLRRRVESESIQSGFGQLKITVSIGLAVFPENGRNADDLIAEADRALYEAKEGGRNRVIAA